MRGKRQLSECKAWKTPGMGGNESTTSSFSAAKPLENAKTDFQAGHQEINK